jgi:hypothetical protein
LSADGSEQNTPAGWKPRGSAEGALGLLGLGASAGVYGDEKGVKPDAHASADITGGDGGDKNKKSSGRGKHRVGLKAEGKAFGSFAWSDAVADQGSDAPIAPDGPGGAIPIQASPGTLIRVGPSVRQPRR